MMQYDAKYAKVKKKLFKSMHYYTNLYKKYESVCKFFKVLRERKNKSMQKNQNVSKIVQIYAKYTNLWMIICKERKIH